MDFVLQDIEKNSLPNLYKSIRRRADFTREWAPRFGLSIYAQSPSDSVTALKVPAHLDSQKIRQYLEEKYNITIMGGQDQAKGKIIRIGHMGYIRDEEMLRLFEKLGETLLHFDEKLFTRESLQPTLQEMKTWLEVRS